MPNFESFAARHPEFSVQALIENLERFEGVRASPGASLEERWHVLMEKSHAVELCMVG